LKAKKTIASFARLYGKELAKSAENEIMNVSIKGKKNIDNREMATDKGP